MKIGVKKTTCEKPGRSDGPLTRAVPNDLIPLVDEERHQEALIRLFGLEKANRVTSKFDKPNDHWSPAQQITSSIWTGAPSQKMTEGCVISKVIEESKLKNTCGLKAFQHANDCCLRRYVRFKLIKKEKGFEVNPDLYCVVNAVMYNQLGEAKNVNLATLGIKGGELPCTTEYKAKEAGYKILYPKRLVEVMRLSFSKHLSSEDDKNLYRCDIMPCDEISRRVDKGSWKNAKEYRGFYYRLINIRKEVGTELFGKLCECICWMNERLGLDVKMTIVIDSHVKVPGFFAFISDLRFVHIEGAEFDMKKIPGQSRVSRQKFNFQLYQMMITGLTESSLSVKVVKE